MGSCYSKSSEHNTKDKAGVGVSIGTREGTIRQSSSGSGRWVKIGSISRKKSAFYEGLDVVNQNHKESRKMFVNGSSDVACLYTQQGKKGTNQDAMLVWENYSSRSDTVFCGVFDGHGPFGHMVAKKVRDTLPLIIYNQWKAYSRGDKNFNIDKDENVTESVTCDETETTSMDDRWHESVDNEEGEKLPEICIPLERSMLRAFNLMDKELKLLPTIDCFCSGTTAVTLVKQGLDLILANIGDSRAVLATRSEDNSLVAVQLTVDLKPDLPREAARIQQCKGRVFTLQDEPEVARVWLPNNDSPGLAMARAFGDFCLKDFGLISVPDIYYRRLTDRDQFIILATDGVWDVLSNKEAIDIVASAPSRATAARALVDCAVRSWRLKYPTSKNDDCAVVCLFLEHGSSTTEVIPANGMMKDLDKAPMAVTEDAEVLTVDGDSHFSALECSGTLALNEIVPVSQETEANICKKNESGSKRSLAECISMAEEDEWSALEGITRVNSLLSLPRFLSSDKRSASWRKWL